MKPKRPWALRIHLALPLSIAAILMWLGIMVILTNARSEELEAEVESQHRSARESQEEQWGFYLNNLGSGLGEQADNILRQNLSDIALRLTDLDGGMALTVKGVRGEEIRSQLAWGYGHEAGVDQGQRWYLEFDSGLDDAGQIALAEWILDHRISWNYQLYPPEAGEQFDGTYARVTGVEKPGYALAVETIDLVAPDGSVTRMVETAPREGENITLELRFLKVSSVLLPSYWSDGHSGPVNMERRLENFHEAHAILDREMAGEFRATLHGGRLSGTHDGDDSARWVATYCPVYLSTLQQMLSTYFGSLVFVICVILLLSHYLSRRVTEPVEALCAQAQRGETCPVDGSIRELNTLARAINSGQEHLEEQIRREREFTRSAAHELKTPLAVLRSHAEALREDIDPEKRKHYLDVVLEESDRMAALVGSLLELSRLESGIPLNRETLELGELVRGCFQRLELAWKQKEIRLELELAELWLEGDPGRLRETVGNLCSNALRHCPAGGRVTARLTREAGWAVLEIWNQGEPVSPEDLPHLFEPFYRGDKSRSRESGGTGLGLAIVRAAAEAHGGGCTAENREGGVCFTLRLPAE